MITQEQKQIWREEYLEEMRIISQEVSPLEGRGDASGEDIDDRLLLFFSDVLIPLINSIGYVFQNFPLVVSRIDEEAIPLKEEDVLSLSDVFEYLYAMSQYGRDIVLSEIPNYEPLLQAVQDNEKEYFLRLVQEQQVDFSDICLRVGYTNKILQTLHNALSYFMACLLSETIDDEDEKEIENQVNSFKERIEHSVGKEALQPYIVNEKTTRLVLGMTNLDIKQLDNVFHTLYAWYVLTWTSQCEIVCNSFLEQETAIIKRVIDNEEYRDIINDIKRIAYLIYGFTGEELYDLNDIKALDVIKENLQLN